MIRDALREFFAPARRPLFWVFVIVIALASTLIWP
jgi:hypothetical protein